MREKFIKYADGLIKQADSAKIYEELVKIFSDACMFHEEGACTEKLWHITQKHSLYKTIGDIFAEKLANYGVAVQAYNRYLEFSDKEFYKKYIHALVKSGNLNFNENLDNEDYSEEIVKLSDTYDAIVYMMIYLCHYRDYDGILELDKKLSQISNKIKEYAKLNTSCSEKDCLKDNESSKIHLSQELSKIQHHNDISLLAIKLDENNKQAYINIIGDYITYKNYNEAILFYNYTYCIVFSLPQVQNIIDICWKVSDYYRDKFDFYNAVLFQKFALEIEVAGV